MHFADCWDQHVTDDSESFLIHYLSKAALIKAKRLAGRPQDLADLDEIRRADDLSD